MLRVEALYKSTTFTFYNLLTDRNYYSHLAVSFSTEMKKRSEETQTLHVACSRRSQIFAPPQTPFPGAQDGQNLIS